MPAAATPSGARTETPGLARGSAYGLQLEADFELPGLGPPGKSGVRRTRLELVTEAAIDALWRPADAEEVRRMNHADGSVALVTHRHDRLGWHMSAPGFGRHLVAPDGSRVRSAPAEIAPARWQLVLVGQALPAAAVLAGLEVLHASAVAVDGGAVALTGPPGSGKSTLAAHLVLLGASFLTDDVLALEARGDGVYAHPGLAVAGIRQPAFAELHRRGGERSGRILASHAKVQLAFDPHPAALPLRALYFLERAGTGEPARIEPFTPDPRQLLGSAFSVAIRTRERLARQLGVCARLAASVPAFRVPVPLARDSELAPHLLAHATVAVQTGP
jgi:hypothetical protein